MRHLQTLVLLAAIVLAGCNSNEPQQPAAENQVIETIMARRSVRQYTETPVERDVLQKLVECGINAPNAMNHQDWEFRVVDSEEYLSGVTEVMKVESPRFINADDPNFRNCFRNAPAIIALACPDDESGMCLLNLGLAGENICLAAQSLGLGTCVMAAPAMFLNRSEAAKPYLDKLGFSEGYKLRYVIGVGYPAESPDARPRDMSKARFVD